KRASPPTRVSAMASIDMMLFYTLCDLLWSTGTAHVFGLLGNGSSKNYDLAHNNFQQSQSMPIVFYEIVSKIATLL
ncbi:MAG TPA: hypothetical protein PK105_06350, partial [Rectinema sp.]|nr:hypothetical protein [Rectinema sp.]HQG15614.1 hypothetical protein [Rectinema sp.]HQJ23150.1 hypothetical protein [Rectinema sp.]